MIPVTAAMVDELERLNAAGTPGPWDTWPNGTVAGSTPGSAIRDTVAHTFPSGNGPKHNAALIVAMHAQLPALLATARAHAAQQVGLVEMRDKFQAFADTTINAEDAPLYQAIADDLDRILYAATREES